MNVVVDIVGAAGVAIFAALFILILLALATGPLWWDRH